MRHETAGRRGRLVSRNPVLVLLAAVIFVLAMSNASTFARHVGMQQSHLEQVLEAGVAVAADYSSWPPAARSADVLRDLGDGSGQDESRGRMQLLHAVGACLLLLVGGLLLLLGGDRRRVPVVGPMSMDPRRLGAVLRHRWRPPALSPPVLSPVLRT